MRIGIHKENNFGSRISEHFLFNESKMNGFELYTEIRKIDNQLKVCFITAGEMYYDGIRSERQEEQT